MLMYVQRITSSCIIQLGVTRLGSPLNTTIYTTCVGGCDSVSIHVLWCSVGYVRTGYINVHGCSHGNTTGTRVKAR